MKDIPKKFSHETVESKWIELWNASGLYRWDSTKPREETFVVDTPPPTVSGSLHVGHVFSYTHTDLIVRYQRMCGRNIMYPMGWDDNGLPTERRVQNKFGISCNPHLAYDPDWKPSEGGKAKGEAAEEVSRQNFIEACEIVTEEDEQAFEDLWRHLGLSVDWEQQYATIDGHCRRISQLSFLDLVEKQLVYSAESPTMWDTSFQTALAQADIEDRVKPGAYHDIRFGIEGGGEFVISTTRPELLVACIAVVAHPDDERYQQYFGKRAITPLFSASVPIAPSEHADPEKGSGIMMVCTFGDAADVEWWKTSGLPIKQVLNRQGRLCELCFSEEPFRSRDPEKAAANYQRLQGKTAKQARKIVAELLAEAGSGPGAEGAALVGEPKPIEHPVKFYEKGDHPVEFITTRQWFISLLDHKQELLEQGAKITWHPPHMKARYDNWVDGLQYDWCISRQRYFGVPFPVWYPIADDGSINYEQPIFAAADALPVDPLSQPAPGFDESQRDKPGGFSGDPDVMDTWATSSLSPQVVSRWGVEPQRHKKLFPMDMRPQSHEIIRTWAFYTIAKAWMHEKEVPWYNVVISGWILDPDRKKMSKSKGNVVTPQHLLEQYSADAVRYWAARARLGVDTAYDESVFKNGRKLATKIFNASRFVLTQIAEFGEQGGTASLAAINEEVDRACIGALRKVIAEASAAFERFDYAQALSLAESSFWSFCDHYVELVKTRAYGQDSDQAPSAERASAVACLEWALGCYLRLLAPTMPYITEEVWSWHFAERYQSNSIHKAAWPSVAELAEVAEPSRSQVLDAASAVLSAVHHAKSSAQKTLKWPVASIRLSGAENDLEAARLALGDLSRAGRFPESAAQFVSAEQAGEGMFDIDVELSTEV